MVYIKLFLDYLDAVEPLGDAERGRLFTSLMEYARTGEAPQLGGNERFLFPMMRAQIDRDIAEMEAASTTRSDAGKKGAMTRWQTMANDGKNGKCHTCHSKNGKNGKDKDKDYDKDEEERVGRTAPAQRSFTPPTVEEIAAYCNDRKNGVDPNRFYDFYQAKGWMVGKNRMKDWKAAVRTWERRTETDGKPQSYDLDELEAYWDSYVPDLQNPGDSAKQ